MSVWTSFVGIVTLSPESGVNIKNLVTQCFVGDDLLITTRKE